MNSKKLEIGDDRNTLFELSEPVFEKLKPGVVYGEKEGRKKSAAHDDTSDRCPPCHQKDIPQVSLAERIRKGPKGQKGV